jgi:hypothetical protein
MTQQKEQIENFLKLNGVPIDASAEEIRGALRSARWGEDDIESALETLRGTVKGANAAAVASRQLFHSDAHVEPETLSALLGVSVRTKHKPELAKQLDRSKRGVRTLTTYMLVFGFLAVGIGFFVYALIYIFRTSL